MSYLVAWNRNTGNLSITQDGITVFEDTDILEFTVGQVLAEQGLTLLGGWKKGATPGTCVAPLKRLSQPSQQESEGK